MGGGDLNLKKSWHPQTIRNVEKVWKAEQKAEAESKKIEQLRRELEEERAREDMQRHAVEQGVARKKNEKLDWMYSAPGQVDHEEYLLGKMIDKKVDPLANDKEEETNVPGASFMNDTGANSVSDLAAKVRDDPLLMIKRKEEEKRKELMNNPVKMKQLRQMLQANLDKSKKKEKKRKRKEKKKEKAKRGSDNDEIDGHSSDNERLYTENGKKNVHNKSHGDGRLRSGSSRKRQSDSITPKKKHARRSRSMSPVRKDGGKTEARWQRESHLSPTLGSKRRSRSQSLAMENKNGEKRKERQKHSSRLKSEPDKHQRKEVWLRSGSPVLEDCRETEMREERRKRQISSSPVRVTESNRRIAERSRFPSKSGKRIKKDRKERQRSSSLKTESHQRGGERSRSPAKDKRGVGVRGERQRSSSPEPVSHQRSDHRSRSPSRKGKGSRARGERQKSSTPEQSSHRRRGERSSSSSKKEKRGGVDKGERIERQRSSSPEPESHCRRGERSRSPVQNTRRRSLSESPPRKQKRSSQPRRNQTWQRGSAVSKKMDGAELEKRRAAMMENAKWRDEQRGRNVQRYKEEQTKEDANEALNLGKEAKFIDQMKTQSFSSKSTASVADRIKRNINSIQRTPAALESFLEK